MRGASTVFSLSELKSIWRKIGNSYVIGALFEIAVAEVSFSNAVEQKYVLIDREVDCFMAT